ncbi:hypothetical protein GCM10009776_03760 [Microbacterium deminutum]|uniref:LPXTG cell wall anchor domain-containing protein n=1 Tax=Microbacterium deminutum TaxID=344164 RepID=A0ABN2Q5L7_9MICO
MTTPAPTPTSEAGSDAEQAATAWWPWLVALVLLIAGIVFFVFYRRRTRARAADTPPDATPPDAGDDGPV